MLGGGFDPGFVFRHPLFLVTFIVSVIAWIIAFAGQCASEAKYSPSTGHGPVQGVLWFNIWLELLALSNDALALHRFQISILLAIATALSVAGVQPIFQSPGAFIATGVGWLLLTMVNLVWILYLTSEEDTYLYNLFNAGGNGGLSSNNRRVHSAGAGMHRRDSGAGGYGGEMGSGLGGGMGGGTLGGMGGGGGMTRGISSNTMNGGGYASGGYAPAATDGTPQKGGGAGGDVFGQSVGSPGGEETGYKYRARALYAYSASPDDPNEVSFMKGDILDVVDNSGKWYSVRTPSGATGIAPSNYLTML
ncbi:hypothetical protein IAT38_005639 [Cryptococcus sp. DSM 104549]